MALATLIKRLAVDRLHIVGDIYDRAPRADMIMDVLMTPPLRGYPVGQPRHPLDGRGGGQRGLHCQRAQSMALQYNNLDIIENGYGISLRPT